MTFRENAYPAYATGVSVASSSNQGGLKVRPLYVTYYWQIVFDMGGGATSAGTVKLQGSGNNVNWDDVPSSSQAFTAASTSLSWSISQDAAYPWVRVSITNTSGTGGTAVVSFQGTYEE